VFVQVSRSVGARVQAVCHGHSVRRSYKDLKHLFDACLAGLEHVCYNSYRRSIEHGFDGRRGGPEEETMSAIAWDPGETRLAAPVATRPHLTLVEGGEAAEADPGLRLTARGRLVLFLLAAVVVVATAVLPGLRSAGAVEPEHTVTVRAGQTLSEIAAAELPALSISEGIVAIQLANRMSTAQISADQELVIPAR
jgi:hypothetical protein